MSESSSFSICSPSCVYGQLVIVHLFYFAVLVGMKWYLIVVLICVSLMTNYVEHCFMCLLIICISFLEIFWTFAHLKKVNGVIYLFIT